MWPRDYRMISWHTMISWRTDIFFCDKLQHKTVGCRVFIRSTVVFLVMILVLFAVCLHVSLVILWLRQENLHVIRNEIHLEYTLPSSVSTGKENLDLKIDKYLRTPFVLKYGTNTTKSIAKGKIQEKIVRHLNKTLTAEKVVSKQSLQNSTKSKQKSGTVKNKRPRHHKRRNYDKVTNHTAGILEIHNLAAKTDEDWDVKDDWTEEQLLPMKR